MRRGNQSASRRVQYGMHGRTALPINMTWFFKRIELSAFLYSPEVPPLQMVLSFHVFNFVSSSVLLLLLLLLAASAAAAAVAAAAAAVMLLLLLLLLLLAG